MMLTFDEVSQVLSTGKLYHISGTERLIRELPKGNWIGGSTEYFMTEDGGKVTGDALFVNELPYDEFKFAGYDETDIHKVTSDAYENGFSIVILPFDSNIHKAYANKAADFDGMFMKNIVGWVSGVNINKPEQNPIVINGRTGEVFTDRAVAVHIRVPEDKLVSIHIVNIFEQDSDSPVITFPEEGFTARVCFVNGEKTLFAEYIADKGINTQMPLIGDYSGVGINTSIKNVVDGIVSFYAPVFTGIEYRMAKTITDYEKEFNTRLLSLAGTDSVFSCNCILNFLYGELEGKDVKHFFGPITFGEIAYQLVNQTLVYVTVT